MTTATENKERLIDLAGLETTPRLTVEHHLGDIRISTWEQQAILVQIRPDEDGDIDDMFAIRAQDGHVYIGHDEQDRHWRERGRHAAHEQRRELGRAVEEALRQGDFAAIGDQVGKMFGNMMGQGTAVDLIVKVPVACDVAIRTVSGDTQITGVQGNLYLESANGDVRLDGAGGTLLVKTTSGDFQARGFNGRLGVRSASGDVAVQGGELQAFNIGSVSGDVTLAGALLPDGEYVIRTTSGDALLALPSSTAATIRFRTVSGDVNCALPYTEGREGRRRLTLALNGGGPTVEFGSISGDLNITALDAAAQADREATQRLRREAAPFPPGGFDPFRVEGAATGPLSADSPPRPSAEMAVLEAIERGEMSVDEGLARLSELG